MGEYGLKGLMAVTTAARTAALQKELEEEIFRWISVDPVTLDPIEHDYSDNGDDDEPSFDELFSSQDTSGSGDSDRGGGGGHAAWPTVEEYIEWKRDWTKEDMAGGESIDDILAGNEQVGQYMAWIAGLSRRPGNPISKAQATPKPPKLAKKPIARAMVKPLPEGLPAPKKPSPPQKSGKLPSKAQHVSPLRPPTRGLPSSPPDTPRKTGKSPRKPEGLAIPLKELAKPQGTAAAPIVFGDALPAKQLTTPRKPARGPESAESPSAVRKVAPVREAAAPSKQSITPKKQTRPPKSAGAPSAAKETSPVREPKELVSSRKTALTPAEARKAAEPTPSEKTTITLVLAAQPKAKAEAPISSKVKPKEPKLDGDAVIVSFFTGGFNNTTPARTLKRILNSSDQVLEAHPEYLDCLFPLPDAGEPVLTPAMIVKFNYSPKMKESFLQGYRRMLSFLGFAELPNGSVTQALGFNPSDHPWTTVSDLSRDVITRMIRSMRLLGFDSQAEGFYNCIRASARKFPSMPPGMKTWRRVTFRPVAMAPDAMTPTHFKYPERATPLESTLQPNPPGYSFGGLRRGDSGGGVDPTLFASYRGEKRDSPDSDTAGGSNKSNDSSPPSHAPKFPPPSDTKPLRPAIFPGEDRRALPTTERQAKRVRFNEAELPPLSSSGDDDVWHMFGKPRLSIEEQVAKFLREDAEAARIAKSKESGSGPSGTGPAPRTSVQPDGDLPDYTDDEDAATDVDEPDADDGGTATDLEQSTDDYEPDPGRPAANSKPKSYAEPSWFKRLDQSLTESSPSGPSTAQSSYMVNSSPLARQAAPAESFYSPPDLREEEEEGEYEPPSADLDLSYMENFPVRSDDDEGDSTHEGFDDSAGQISFGGAEDYRESNMLPDFSDGDDDGGRPQPTRTRKSSSPPYSPPPPPADDSVKAAWECYEQYMALSTASRPSSGTAARNLSSARQGPPRRESPDPWNRRR